MKVKIFASIAVVVVFFWALTLTLAQESVPLKPSSTPNPVNYALPYPGLLSDHPLFIFKKTRDLILTQLISNSIKKIEFRILLADKYLNMSIMLLERGNSKKSIESLQDSYAHLSNAYKGLSEIMPEDELHRNNINDRFELSLRKYMEVIQEMKGRGDSGYTSQLDDLESKSQALYDEFLSKK